MKLNLIEKGMNYTVLKILSEDPLTLTYFNNLGILNGAEIFMVRKAPWFKDPVLFQVGESQIALTTREASLIEVEEV